MSNNNLGIKIEPKLQLPKNENGEAYLGVYLGDKEVSRVILDKKESIAKEVFEKMEELSNKADDKIEQLDKPTTQNLWNKVINSAQVTNPSLLEELINNSLDKIPRRAINSESMEELKDLKQLERDLIDLRFLIGMDNFSFNDVINTPLSELTNRKVKDRMGKSE